MPGLDSRVIVDTTTLDKFNQRAPGLAGNAVKVLISEMHQDVDAHWSGTFPPASMAGMPPAIRSEDLKNSAEEKQLNATTWVLRYLSKHANYLEFGTFKMRARPYIRPAQKRIQKQFRRVFTAKFKVSELTYGR